MVPQDGEAKQRMGAGDHDASGKVSHPSHHRGVLLPAWPTAGGAGSKWPAGHCEALSDQPERQAGKRFRRLQLRKHRAPTLFTHHEVGEALKRKRDRAAGGGRTRKKEKRQS